MVYVMKKIEKRSWIMLLVYAMILALIGISLWYLYNGLKLIL